MNIIEACKDERLFRNFLKWPKKDHPVYKFGSINSWRPWFHALRVLYGLPIPERSYDLIRRCTGREPALFPDTGFRHCLWLCGRRSGKSRMAAVICAYEAILAGHETRLSKGEVGYVAIVSPTRSQSRIVHDYMREIFNSSDVLREQVKGEVKNSFELHSGIRVEILTGSGAKLRGRTICCCVADELAHMGYEEESRVSDSEMIAAIRPALMTTQGKLVCITTPFAQKGFTYQTYKKHFGNDKSDRMIVWNAPSLTMNDASLTQAHVDAEIAEDPAKARAEYLSLFREDVGIFLSREAIERCVIRDRTENLPSPGVRYFAAIDISGGRSDDGALAISHKEGRKVVIDLLRRYRPPFSPYDVIGQMAKVLKQWNIRKASADSYAAEFVTQAGKSHGIVIEKSQKPKSQLYLELLPKLTSEEIELLDDEVSIKQLANLERRTKSGGRDVIDHPSGAGMHDDLANVIALAADLAAARRTMTIGALSSWKPIS